jgi:hypothetical protein
MIPLSRAIRQGSGADPLEAALSLVFSGDPTTRQGLHALYKAWPHLGASVRTLPKLVDRLPKGIVAPYSSPYDKPESTVYRREVHASLYRTITVLYDKHDWKKDEIADLLASVRL